MVLLSEGSSKVNS